MADTLPEAPAAQIPPRPAAPARPGRAPRSVTAMIAAFAAIIAALMTTVDWYRVTLALVGTDPVAGHQTFSQSFDFRGTRVWLGVVVVGVALGVALQAALALRFRDRSVGLRVAGSAAALVGLVAVAWPAGPKLVEDYVRDRSGGLDIHTVESTLRSQFPNLDIHVSLTTTLGGGYRATLIAAVVALIAGVTFAFERRMSLDAVVPSGARTRTTASVPMTSGGAATSGFLSGLLADVRNELATHPLNERALRAALASAPPVRDFGAAIGAGNPALIAEIKRASPSAGRIGDADAASHAIAYQGAGASAVSVLTLPRHFGGSLEDLQAVRAAVQIPVLRKDFLVDPRQLLEARALGADAALLIVAALSDGELQEMLAAAHELGLAALVEAHDRAELDRALAAGATIVGVNARDLATLDVDTDRALELVRLIPEGVRSVLESGISTRDQVVRAVDAGADAILVGEALMRADDVGGLVRRLLGTSGGVN